MGDHARSLGAVVFFFFFFLSCTPHCLLLCCACACAFQPPPALLASFFLHAQPHQTSLPIRVKENTLTSNVEHRHDSHSHLHCSHSALASFLHNFLYPRRFHSPTPSSSNGVDFVSVHGYHLIVDVLKQKSECRPAHGENRVLNSWFKHR